MRIFVTGASGWIGSAVVHELISHRTRGPGPGLLGRRRWACRRVGRRTVPTFVGLDMSASSAITRELFECELTELTLTEDIENGAYSNGSGG